jgi:hypothetical protein
MNIKGKILEIFPVQQVRENFRKREFVIEYRENSQYAEYIKFELIQDRCDLLESFKTGEEIDVHFNLKGRIWTNPQGEKVYFNSLQAWRLEKQKDSQDPEPQTKEKSPPGMNIDLSSPDPTDDLPF